MDKFPNGLFIVVVKASLTVDIVTVVAGLDGFYAGAIARFDAKMVVWHMVPPWPTAGSMSVANGKI